MPLNATMIGAFSTASGGAVFSALPLASYVNAVGCVLAVGGTLIWSRKVMEVKLAAVLYEARQSRELSRRQVALLEDLKDSTHTTGPHTLPPPPLRRIV